MGKREGASVTADGTLVRAVRAVHFAVADLVGGEADRSVVGTRVLGRLADGRFAGLFIGAVLAVNVAVAHPALGDTLACGEQSVESEWHQKRFYFKRRKASPSPGYAMLPLSCMGFNVNIFNVEMKWS